MPARHPVLDFSRRLQVTRSWSPTAMRFNHVQASVGAWGTCAPAQFPPGTHYAPVSAKLPCPQHANVRGSSLRSPPTSRYPVELLVPALGPCPPRSSPPPVLASLGTVNSTYPAIGHASTPLRLVSGSKRSPGPCPALRKSLVRTALQAPRLCPKADSSCPLSPHVLSVHRTRTPSLKH